ncbi:hypothetical protein P19_0255 [Aeromonas phage P19]|uniref:Uncharacterized protein n=1 Tax=Aeromonas phage vB_AdhaM_G2 TaxID=3238786 RepID=A0AB39TZU2_9CAUD|nr:hypothetical protein P19_0255 [Aeromonas phage P19]
MNFFNYIVVMKTVNGMESFLVSAMDPSKAKKKVMDYLVDECIPFSCSYPRNETMRVADSQVEEMKNRSDIKTLYV